MSKKKLLKDLSRQGQVFCITHQPLVAAVADNHFSVRKFLKDGITTTEISHLNNPLQRQRELTELAGGDGKEAKLYAASLLDQQVA